jgi:hypothetical protein
MQIQIVCSAYVMFKHVVMREGDWKRMVVQSHKVDSAMGEETDKLGCGKQTGNGPGVGGERGGARTQYKERNEAAGEEGRTREMDAIPSSRIVNSIMHANIASTLQSA